MIIAKLKDIFVNIYEVHFVLNLFKINFPLIIIKEAVNSFLLDQVNVFVVLS